MAGDSDRDTRNNPSDSVSQPRKLDLLKARVASEASEPQGLQFGDVWWIADTFTNVVGTRGRHPWVVVVPSATPAVTTTAA